MTYPQFVDHLVFRVANLSSSERFYTILLGQPPHRTEDSIMYQVGRTRLFFTLCDQPQPGPYAKEEVGLNHLAFGVRTLEELQRFKSNSAAPEFPIAGLRKTDTDRKNSSGSTTPTKMRIEFYLRTA